MQCYHSIDLKKIRTLLACYLLIFQIPDCCAYLISRNSFYRTQLNAKRKQTNSLLHVLHIYKDKRFNYKTVVCSWITSNFEIYLDYVSCVNAQLANHTIGKCQLRYFLTAQLNKCLKTK